MDELRKPSPPHVTQRRHVLLASWILRLCIPKTDHDEIAGDILEAFTKLRSRFPTSWRPHIWYWRQITLAAAHGLVMHWHAPAVEQRRKEDVFMTFVQDLRYAVRTLWRRPGFAAVVIGTLALGIGATTSVFSVVNGVLLRPLPYDNADRLTLVWGRMSTTEVDKAPFSGLDLLDFRERALSFDAFAGVFGVNSTLIGDFEPEPIQLGIATDNFFSVLGVDPVHGRLLQAGDQKDLDISEVFGANVSPPPSVAVLSHGLWQRRFGGKSDVLGRSVRINGQPMTIVGVLPRDFRLYLPPDAAMPRNIDVWSPLPAGLNQGTRDQQWLTVIGRLKTDVALGQARAEMDGIAAQFRTENQFHTNTGMEIDVIPMQADVVGQAQPILLTLLGAVAFVLIIACANIANLLLVRAQARRQEMAIRAALGGGRSRIIRQLFTESAVFAVLGGGLGLLLATVGTRLLLTLRPANLPRAEHVGLDLTVLGFGIGASVLAALLFGTLPALQSSKTDLNSSLRTRNRGGSSKQWTRSGLVVTEVALSLVLLIGSGLMVRSFAGLQRVEPGFDPHQMLTVNIALPIFSYSAPGQSAEFHTQLSQQIAALPGVEAVGAVTPLPLAGGGQFWFGPYALNEASDEEWSRNEVDYRPTVPGLFAAMGTQLLAGREFEHADNRLDARRVVIVDEKMAQRAWPDENPLDKRILIMRPDAAGNWDRYWATVVGVVEHVRYDDLRADGRETIYMPQVDWAWADMNYVVRTSTDPVGLSSVVRQTIRDIDPEIPAAAVRPFDYYVGEAVAPTRFALVVITVFAVVALILSTVGLYGVIAYAVRQRTQEIGIRMAFGAERTGIIKLVLRQGLGVTALGLVVGLIASLVVSRLISHMLFGVTHTDPITYLSITAVVSTVAFLACYAPARRATRVDPVVALRNE